MINTNAIVAEVINWFFDAPEEDRVTFIACPYNKVAARYHTSLGRSIRNEFGLWQHKWEPLLINGVDHSPDHPDAVSSRIIEEVHSALLQWDKHRPIVITGGIATGKSTIAKSIPEWFPELRLTYVSVDSLVADLYKQADVARFMINMYGTTDKKTIGSLVFNDPKLMAVHNAFMLPYVKDLILRHMLPGTVIEIPLYYQMVSDPINADWVEQLAARTHWLIEVLAHDSTRIDRIMQRDGLTAEQARVRLDSQQMTSPSSITADYFILNNGDGDMKQAVTAGFKILEIIS